MGTNDDQSGTSENNDCTTSSSMEEGNNIFLNIFHASRIEVVL